MNILLIEDDPTDAKLFTAVLEEGGHVVRTQTTAEAAIGEIKEHRPGIILIDLKLPGLDGVELARRLNQDPEAHDIPIAAVTAAPEMFPRETVIAAGYDDYLLKPVDTRTLCARLTALSRGAGRENCE